MSEARASWCAAKESNLQPADQESLTAAGSPSPASRRCCTPLWPAAPSAARSWRWDSCDSARAAVVHGHRAVAERLRREQLELARARQPALVQRRAVAGDPGMD